MVSKSACGRYPDCPHCHSGHTVRWGTARGVPRYRCKSCKHTFNVLTNTPLAHLRYKKRWLTYLGTMVEKKGIRESAAACSVSVATSSRWHRRFLDCSSSQRIKILGTIIGTSSTQALVSLSETAANAELSCWRELLLVILSWI